MEDCLEQPLATPEEEWDDEFSASQVLRRPSPNKVARAAPTFFLASLLEKQKLRTGEAHSLGHTRPWRLAALTADSLAPGPSTRWMEVAHGQLRLLEMPLPVRDTLHQRNNTSSATSWHSCYRQIV